MGDKRSDFMKKIPLVTQIRPLSPGFGFLGKNVI